MKSVDEASANIRITETWLVLVAALFALTLIPVSTSALTQDFAAFAYSPSRGVVASNIGYSKPEAQAAAELACRAQGGDEGECQAAAWFRNSLGAFALASNGRWGWGWGSSQATADSNALHYCQAVGPNCQIVHRERTASIAITSLAYGETIAPMRGKWSITGFTEGQGDHKTGTRDYWAVDFVSNDSAVYPVRPGRVVFADWDCRVLGYPPQPPNVTNPGVPCYGYVVVIDHGNNISSLYAHLALGSLAIKGTEVGVDEPIGAMSDSGCGTACGEAHLHFAVRKGSLTPDPLYSPNTPVRTPWHK